MAKKIKNPLDVFFGAFLQEERKLLSDYTIEEICQKGMLGMSSSLYKMAEAGLTSINVNRLPDLMRVFKSSDLLFDRLAKYSAGQSYIDHLMISYKQTPKDSFAELADVDSEFKHLYEKSLSYFEYEEGSLKQKKFVQESLISEIRHFLQNAKYPSEIKEKFAHSLIEKIRKVPTLSIEILINFIDSYSQIAPLHFGDIAAEWEKKNSNSFVENVGFYKDPNLILDKANLRKFNYDYLARKDFKSLKFIFDTDKTQQELEDTFKKNLTEVRNEAKLEPLDSQAFSKIELKPLEKNKKNKVHELVIDPHNAKNDLQAFWIFTNKEGNQIGFVGISKDFVSIGYNLSYSETERRYTLFKQIWDKSNEK